MKRKSCSSSMAIPIILRLALLTAIMILALTISFGVGRANINRLPLASVNSPNSVADIRLIMYVSPSPYYVGDEIVFTLTVDNLDPLNSASVIVTDTLPVGTNVISATPGSCSVSNPVVCVLDDLLPGANEIITIVVSYDGTGSFTNSATATNPDGDPNPGNNEPSYTILIEPKWDLSVNLVPPDPNQVIAGEDLAYTVQVTNHGPSAISSVKTTIALPAGVSLISATPSDYNCDGSPVSCSLDSLAPEITRNINLQLSVSPNLVGMLVISAAVEDQNHDPNLDNNNASLNTPITPQADLAVTLIDTPDPVFAGNNVIYSIIVTNNGPSTSRQVSFVNTFPDVVTFQSFDPTTEDCTPGGNILTCNLGNLEPLESIPVTVVATVDPAFSGEIEDQVNVSSARTGDPDPNDDSASTTTIVNLSSDLSVAILPPMPNPAVAGQVLTYTVQIVNNGPSKSASVTLTNTLPGGVNFISVSPSQGTCDGTGPISCSLGSMDPVASASVQLRVSVPAIAEGMLTDSAEVSGPNDDPVLVNDTTSLNTPISAQADLAIIQTTTNPAIAGQVLTYTISITNTGPSTAKSVVLIDTLPVSVTLDRLLPSQGTCANDVSIICNLENLNPDYSATILLRVNVPPEIEGTLINSVKVTGDDHDPYPANNTTSLETPVSPQADLAVTLSDPFDPISAGNDVIYEIAVSNNGPSTAKQVSIKNTFPEKVTFKSSDPVIAGCTQVTNTLTCPLGNIAPDSTFSMTITASVALTVTGTIEDKVEVLAGTNDSTPTNNITSTITTVNPPTIKVQWISPVVSGENGAIYSAKTATITLSVNATSILGIGQVAFLRYDPGRGFRWIGIDDEAPYSITINTSDLNYGWNQVFVDVYDNRFNRSNLWLWIVTPYKIYLPSVSNR